MASSGVSPVAVMTSRGHCRRLQAPPPAQRSHSAGAVCHLLQPVAQSHRGTRHCALDTVLCTLPALANTQLTPLLHTRNGRLLSLLHGSHDRVLDHAVNQVLEG